MLPINVSLHAIERFRERIADLPAVEALHAIIKSLLACGVPLPGQYDPETRVATASPYAFLAVMRGGGEEGPRPIVVTILWKVLPKKEKRKGRRRG